MKNQIIKLLIVLFGAIIETRCSEIYDPQLDIPADILVVEAHMTDKPETYYVKLSSTTPFNSLKESTPVSGAKIWVTDNKDNSIQMYSETGRGYYSYNPGTNNIAVSGDSYTLHIETSDGNIYESSPEEISSSVVVDSVYGIRKNRTELIQSPDGGSSIPTINSYIDIIADIQTGTNSTPKVRFAPDWIFEMIDYHRDIIGGPPVPPTFSWSYLENNSLYISDLTDNNILTEQYAGSLLVNNLAYFYAKQNLSYIVVVLNFYCLNNDSYSFYNEMKKQLSADDALFDPVEEQVTGNIKCISNPDKQVTGLFDVASHQINAFLVNPNSGNRPPALKPAEILHGLPDETNGKTEGIPPDWWFE